MVIKFNAERFFFLIVAFYGVVQVIISNGVLAYGIKLFLVFLLILLAFNSRLKSFLSSSLDRIPYLKLFFLYTIIILVHSIIIADSYEKWRYLITVFFPMLLLPFISRLFQNIKVLGVFVEILLKFCIPLSFLFIILENNLRLENNQYVYYSNFLYFLILIIPFISTKWKILVISVSIFSFIFNLDNRANLLNILVGYSFIFIYQFKYIRFFIYKYLRLIFFLIPFVFISGAFLFNFNIWQYMSSGEQLSLQTESKDVTFLQDSRTGIYLDIYNHLNKNEWSWIFGASAVAVHDTILAESHEGYSEGRMGGSESGFLSFLLFGGIVYVFLYFLLNYYASKRAIGKFNNGFMHMLAAYIAFRWMFTFIENPMGFQFSWIINFMLIGLCYNINLSSISTYDLRDIIRNSLKYKFILK